MGPRYIGIAEGTGKACFARSPLRELEPAKITQKIKTFARGVIAKLAAERFWPPPPALGHER